jgi:hypothetical protein
MKVNKVLTGTPSLDEFINDWLPQLPQVKQINIENAKRWYHIMAKRPDDRFEWHFKRLSGIGGSEIGELAQRALGYSATYTQVEHIINQKLMISPPDLPNNYMRRGILAEGMIAKIFHEDYAASRRKDLMKKITGHQISWMRGNPDDIVEIQGAIGIIDYKAATEVPDQTYLIYQAQLQFYDYLLADAMELTRGIMPEDLKQRTEPLATDFMVNVFLDYENGTTAPIFVPYDGNLMNAMIEAGDAVWMHITKGHPLPDYMSMPTEQEQAALELTANQLEKLKLAERRVCQLKSASDAIYFELEKAKEDIVAFAKEVSGSPLVKDVKLPFSAAGMTTRVSIDKERWQSILNGMTEENKAKAIDKTSKLTTNLDETKVIALLERHGIDVDLSSLCKTEFDTGLVAEFCKEHKFAPAIKESTSIAMGRSKVAKTEIKAIQDEVKDDIGMFISRLSKTALSVVPKNEVEQALENALGNG